VIWVGIFNRHDSSASVRASALRAWGVLLRLELKGIDTDERANSMLATSRSGIGVV